MKTNITLLLAAILSLSLQQNANAQKSIAPFTAHSISLVSASPSHSGFFIREENNKVIIDWNSADNQSVNYFEVETSTDGNSFNLAGLVFGSEKTDSQDYTFYEKVRAQKSYYRVRIILKNGNVSYSPVLTSGTEKK